MSKKAEDYTVDEVPVFDPEFIKALELGFDMASMVLRLGIEADDEDFDNDLTVDERSEYIILKRIVLDLHHYRLIRERATKDD